MTRKLSLCMLILVIANPCLAAPTTSHERLAAKILEMDKLEERVRKGLEFFWKMTVLGVGQSLDKEYQRLTATSGPDECLKRIVAETKQKYADQKMIDNMTRQILDIDIEWMTKHFSEQETQEIVTFMQTEAGRKWLDSQDQMTKVSGDFVIEVFSTLAMKPAMELSSRQAKECQ